MGLFNFIKKNLTKVYSSFTEKISSVFSRKHVDESFFQEIQKILLSADTGVKTTNTLVQKLSTYVKENNVDDMQQIRTYFASMLVELVQSSSEASDKNPRVVMMVGVNGSGKTTFIGKYARKLKEEGKRVLLVAGDTFRAAACQQLDEWARRIGVDIFVGNEQQDPSSVIFDASRKFKEEHFDHMIIDTAGRLQTKVNLMRELEKIYKVLDKQLPDTPLATWITVDAMIGQNSFQQVSSFCDAAKVNGIVLTKLDGTGKGGIIFSIVDTFKVPVVYISYGEKVEDLAPFDPGTFVHDLLEK